MKGLGKIKVILFWDENNYGCQFRRGRDQEEWQDMTRDEQIHAVGAMRSMSQLFQRFIKEEAK